MTISKFTNKMLGHTWDDNEVEMAQHLLETNKTTGAALRQMEEVLLLEPSQAYSLWLHTSHVKRQK